MLEYSKIFNKEAKERKGFWIDVEMCYLVLGLPSMTANLGKLIALSGHFMVIFELLKVSVLPTLNSEQ